MIFLLIGLYIAIGIIVMSASFYWFAKGVKNNDYADEKYWAAISGLGWPVAIVVYVLIGVCWLVSNYFDLIIKISKSKDR